MSKSIQMFSSQAYEWLDSKFDTNTNLYRSLSSDSNEFWSIIEDQLRRADLEISPIVTLSQVSLVQELEIPKETESWSDIGLRLYGSFGRLTPEIIMCPEFWSYISHRFFHNYIIANTKEKSNIRQQFFLKGYPRGLNTCYLSRYYLAVKWTDEMLAECELNSICTLSLKECLGWFDTDQIKHMFDRRPFCSPTLRSCFIEMMVEETTKDEKNRIPSSKKRKIMRSFFESINRLYGGSLIEILDKKGLSKLMHEEFERIKADNL